MENEHPETDTDELENHDVGLIALALNLVLEDDEPIICKREDLEQLSPVRISILVNESLQYFSDENQEILKRLVQTLNKQIEGETNENENKDEHDSSKIPVQTTLV